MIGIPQNVLLVSWYHGTG